MVFFIAIGTFLSTYLGGSFALRLRDNLHLILGFSAGAVIGVAFFDLMPEALLLGSDEYSISFITSMIALGFALYLIVDRFAVLHRHHDTAHRHAHIGRGLLGASSLSLHSFLDGVGLGLAFKVSPTLGLTVALAVLVHDFSDGINTVNMILKNGGSRREAAKWLFFDAVAPVVGVLSTIFFTVSASTLGLLLALFTGFFLYIGASDLLPESHHEHPVWWTTIATILGLGGLYIVVRLAAL